ncbi:MAG: HupE/UreJ family protein [Alphaproteobacteria bacterium]|nr:HupE/UreJ family protein [Alphaproteobacteria bacterium]
MLRIFVFALALVVAAPAFAHTRSQSSSHWRIEGDVVRGRVEADALDVTRLYALGGEAPMVEQFRRHVEGAFDLAAGAETCAPEGQARTEPAPVGRVAAEAAFRCKPGALAAGVVSLNSRLFVDVAPSHLHFASISDGKGGAAEAVLTDARRTTELHLQAEARAESSWAAFLRFIPIGSEHVWGGLDHLAFILALTLLAKGWRAIAIAATGFTVGHTLTLGLSALGVVHPHGPTVEALIGFTVAFVALEAAVGGEARLTRWSMWIALALLALVASAAAWRIAVLPMALVGLAVFAFAYPRGFARGASAAPWLAAGFGLIHGCGFARALSELELPRPHLLSALAGFNVGVELAQATVVVGALATAALARRLAPAAAAIATDVFAASLFGLGLFWFASRTFGA